MLKFLIFLWDFKDGKAVMFCVIITGLPATQKTTIIQINHLPALCLVVRRGIKMLTELNIIQKMDTRRMESK